MANGKLRAFELKGCAFQVFNSALYFRAHYYRFSNRMNNAVRWRPRLFFRNVGGGELIGRYRRLTDALRYKIAGSMSWRNLKKAGGARLVAARKAPYLARTVPSAAVTITISAMATPVAVPIVAPVMTIPPVPMRRAVATRSVISARGKSGAGDHQKGHSKFQVTGHSKLQARCIARRCSLGGANLKSQAPARFRKNGSEATLA
jgi:hypothetical protein